MAGNVIVDQKYVKGTSCVYAIFSYQFKLKKVISLQFMLSTLNCSSISNVLLEVIIWKMVSNQHHQQDEAKMMLKDWLASLRHLVEIGII